MPRPDKVQLKDKHGRIMAEMETPESIVATAETVGLTRAVFIKHEAKQYTGYVEKSVLDEFNVRTVEIPANFAGLEAVDVPTRLMDQLFEIYDVDEQDEYVEISARHIFYRNLKNYTLWKPTADTEYTAAAIMRNVMSNAMFESSFDVASDCTDTKPGSEFDYERKNLVECFLDPENGICAKFGLSMIRDNTFFYCLKDVGYDRGYLIESGKNLIGVDRHENQDGVATRVAPYGKDSKGEIVWMNHNGLKYIDSQYIDTYAEPMLELYDTGLQIGKDDVTADNIQAKLLEAAQKRFDEDEVDLPEVTMTINFISLGDTEEFAQYRGLDKVYLYDILTIRDAKRGYNYSAQVIGVEHDVLTGRLISVTIGSIKNADASRKIATWQVPEVDGRNIRLLSIQAGMFEPGAIGADDLQEHIIKYAHFASATIDSLTTEALEAAQAHIHELIAGSITADDIQAGSITTATLAAGAVTADKIAANAITAGKIAAGAITTEKLDASAVTAAKIAAGAVTADKIAAGAIRADKIDATDLAAINATLGTASIADARIQLADIDYAQIKDLHAGSAYLDQAIFQEAVGGKLYVPRLSVGYAQMIGATIGDLVIQASDGNFYGIDVDLAGNVTATRRTVTAGEIATGHTTDGRTLVLGTDILATDLNTENIYASHALMNEITASVINVDELFAREATIGKINAMDLSSNTYIQATIGTWTSGSTITQTINSLDSRISSLGYGTVYFQADEPSHADLLPGDIWIQSTPNGTWQDVLNNYATWNAINGSVGTWQTLGGIPKMFTWDGRYWQEMYDALLPQTLQTEIQQMSDEIALRATMADLDILSGEVSEFSAELTIQAQEIQSAVSAVNQKASSYVMPVDPRTAYMVSVGDIWIKTDETASWTDVGTKNASWNEVKTKYDAWMRLIGSATYVWDGSKWVETSDRASEIHQRTLIDQTINEVTILAEASATLNDELYRTKAELTITNDSIRQEVLRATTAEGGKIDKTSQYQTADAIVNEAVNQSGTIAGQNFIAKTTQYQTAAAIVSEAVSQAATAGNATYLAKTSSYQTADAIVTEAVRQAGTNANSAYIKKTTTYQDASSIVTSAVSQAGTNASNTYIKKSGSYTSVDTILAEAQAKADAAATSAKNASIAKTQTYQTAAAIVSSAVAQAASSASGLYLAKTTSYQTADAIVNAAVNTAGTSASNLYIAKTTNYTNVSSILGYADAKASAAETAAKNASIAKTATYQDASAIVNAAATYTNGKLNDYSTTTQTSAMIAQYVGNNAYGKVSGITIASAGIDISGSQYVKIASGGCFRVTSGNFGIKSDAGTNEYVLWSGASTAASSGFRVKKNGEVTLTKLMILNESGTEEIEVNLRTYNLWKLAYHPIKTVSSSGGYCTGMEIEGLGSVNFKSATAGWSEAVAMVGNMEEEDDLVTIQVPAQNYGQPRTASKDVGYIRTAGYDAGSPKGVAIGNRVSGTMYQATVTRTDDTTVQISAVDCSTPYNDGQVAGQRTGWSSAASMVGTMSEEDDLVTIQVPSASYNQPRTASLDVTYIRTAGSKQGYNTALSDAGIPSGGTVYSGGTYYGRLYTVGTHGEPILVGSGVVGPTSHELSTK